VSQFIFPPLTASLDSEQSDGGALPSAIMVVGGYDGSAVQVIKTDADGNLQVDVLSAIGPSNYATDTLQTAGNAILTTIDTDTGNIAGAVSGTEMQVDIVADGAGLATSAKQDTIETTLTAIETDADTIAGAVSSGQMQVDIVADGAGLATSAKQDTLETTLTAIETDVDTSAGAVSAIQSAQGVTDTGIPALVVRNDVLADLSGADGDYAPVQVNATGAVYTVLSAGTAEVGKLAAGTASIGTVILGAGTANIGALTAGTAEIGKLAAGTAAIGSVTIGTSTGVDIGNVGLLAGTNEIGKLAAGTAIIGKLLPNTPVDFLDAGVFDASTGTSIPSTGSAVLVTLAADCKEIEVVDDIGEYMSLRLTDGTVKAYLPLGGGRVKCSLSTGDAMKLYSETGTTISSGKIAMNFLS